MILTVTPNTALDRVLRVPRLTPNRTLRSQPALLSPTGKGVDVSLFLAELGYETAAMGFAAGAAGRQLEAALIAKGVTAALTWVEGETRTNIVILGDEDGTHTTITSDSLRVAPEHVDQLVAEFERRVTSARCVALGGSLPAGVDPSFYARLIGIARARGVPVILDASGATFRAALPARPDWVKPNREELEGLAGVTLPSLVDVHAAALDVVRRHGCGVLASLGAEGALAVTTTAAWFVPALRVPVVNPAGAGDALVTGLAAALAQGWPLERGLRLGAAAAASTLGKPGTAECERGEVERLEGEVRVVAWSEDLARHSWFTQRRRGHTEITDSDH